MSAHNDATMPQERPTEIPLGNTAQILLEQLTEHQLHRPFDPEHVGLPPEYEISRMDEWQRTDSALRLVLGHVLTAEAADLWRRASVAGE